MKVFSKKRKKKDPLNNKGLTLIEIIVALLIMGIIVVPLLRLFSTVIKVNQLNSATASADTVAQNIMEAVKVNGLDKTAKEIYLANEKLTSSSNASCLGCDVTFANQTGETSVSSITKTPNPEAEGGYVYPLVERSDKTYEYDIGGIREGNDTYNVNIKFVSEYTITGVPEGETEEQQFDVNDVKVMDLSAFNSDEVAFINPVVGSMYYDEKAIEYFVTLNSNYNDRQWEAECARRQRINDAAWDEYYYYINQSIPTPTPVELTMPSRSDYADAPFGTIVDSVERTVNITVEKDNHTNEYILNSSIVYKIPGTANLVGDDDETYEATNYCMDIEYEKLSSIYFIHIPYRYMTRTCLDPEYRDKVKKGEEESIFTADPNWETHYPLLEIASGFDMSNESVIYNNMSGDKINLYIVTQAKSGATYTGEMVLNVNHSGDPSDLHGTQDLPVNRVGGTGTYYTDLIQTGEKKHENRIVKVTIAVTSEDGQTTRTISSTIQN